MIATTKWIYEEQWPAEQINFELWEVAFERLEPEGTDRAIRSSCSNFIKPWEEAAERPPQAGGVPRLPVHFPVFKHHPFWNLLQDVHHRPFL